MTTAMAIAAGGALGALMRWLMAAPLNSTGLPWGTLTVNIVGSLLIGVVLVVFADKGGSEALRAGIVVGLLGGFTTFSAFSLETVQLLERGQVKTALLYAVGSMIICVCAAYTGIRAARLALSV